MERKQLIASLDKDQIEKLSIYPANFTESNDKPELTTLEQAEVRGKVLKNNFIDYRTRTYFIITRSDENISF